MAAEVPQIRAADPEDPEELEDSWYWAIAVAISAL